MARRQTSRIRPSATSETAQAATQADTAQPMQPMLITVQEACRRLGVSRTVLYPYLMNGTLRNVILGKSERKVFAADLVGFVEALWEEQRYALVG